MKNKIKGSSETIRAACTKEIEKITNTAVLSKNRYETSELFSYWLAGLIDADGCLLVSKAGYTSCEITVGAKEFSLLSLVKKKPWRFHHREKRGKGIPLAITQSVWND